MIKRSKSGSAGAEDLVPLLENQGGSWTDIPESCICYPLDEKFNKTTIRNESYIWLHAKKSSDVNLKELPRNYRWWLLLFASQT
jgi:hypothetical protein